jgi:opacity protein-like surface antigen
MFASRCWGTGRLSGAAKTAAAAAAMVLCAVSGASAQNCNIPTNGSAALPGATASAAAIASVVSSTLTAADTAFLLQGSAFVASPPNPAPNQQGGGIWVRGVGGQVTEKSNTNATLSVTGAEGNTGPFQCATKIDETFGGVQFGSDLAKLNLNGWNIHVGTTAGVLLTNGNLVGGGFSFHDDAAPTGELLGGGSFTSSTQIPFVGLYAAASYGGFSVDGLLRFSDYQSSLNAPGFNLSNQKLDAQSISFSGSIAYNWQVPNSDWFIEPSAGIILSRTKVDPFNYVSAGAASFAGILDDRMSSSLQLNDIHSDVGRLGLRFGTTINGGSVIWQPFGAVSVWHEFGPNVTSTTNICTTCPPLPAPISAAGSVTTSTSTLGTYGQYSLGTAATLAGTGWLGFIRVDYRNGSNLEGWSGTGGIRYQFTPEAAPKPIIKTKAPPSAALQAVNWTGFYIGGFGSANLGRADWNYGTGSASPHIAGFGLGGDIGYDYQINQWVLGVGADLEWLTTRGDTACAPLAAVAGVPPLPAPMFQMTCKASADWLATVTGRLGYTWDRVLLYAKVGAAWTDEHFSATCNFAPCFNPTNVPSSGLTANNNSVGWVAGYGTEFALTPHWTAKAEADYISFGDTSVTASDGSLLRVGMHVWETKVGVNYRF